MQDNYDAHSTATTLGGSSHHRPSMSEKKAELSRCQCCTAAIPAARNFTPTVNTTAISCIVCGHQNPSSDSFAPSSDREPIPASRVPLRQTAKKESTLPCPQFIRFMNSIDK